MAILLQNQTNREALVADMVQYFGRQTDQDDLKDKIKLRYFSGITTQIDKSNPQGKVIQTYEKGPGVATVDSGMVEAITMGFGNKVAKALASLFSQSGCSFNVTHDNKELDLTDIQSTLDTEREKGNFRSSLVDCDLQSCQIGSSCILLTYDNGLKYQKVSSGQVRVYFDDVIFKDGKPRITDYKNIEDAICIVIKLGYVDVALNRYLAIFPRSEENPNGRYVYFTSADGDTIPDKDENYGPEDGVIEYTIDDKPANPLSYFANKHPEIKVPEFPLIVIDGNICDSEETLPITDTLYNTSLEIDVAVSHILGRSQKQIVGTKAIILKDQGADRTIPRTLDGDVSLGVGQDIKSISGNYEGSKSAMEILESIMIHEGASYNVPDFMIISRDYTLDASSGVALKTKASQLIKDRDERINLNRQQIIKLFNIEKVYLNLFSDYDDSFKNTIIECSMSWQAGKLSLPEDKNLVVNRISILMDKGLMDTIDGIKEYHDYSTDDEAIAHYKKMKDRAAEFPPLKAQTKALGLKSTINNV